MMKSMPSPFRTPPPKTDRPLPRKARRITAEYLHNAALFYLQRYAASTGRLREVLTRKIHTSCRDHPDQIPGKLLPLIETEIENLLRLELLNDARYGEMLVSGWRARGLSARMISRKLDQRGLPKDLIPGLLKRPEDGTDETVKDRETLAALRLLQRRKLGPFLPDGTPMEPKEKQKLKARAWGALARQGYEGDLIERVMRMPLNQARDYLS